jgi:hypothetical protein
MFSKIKPIIFIPRQALFGLTIELLPLPVGDRQLISHIMISRCRLFPPENLFDITWDTAHAAWTP